MRGFFCKIWRNTIFKILFLQNLIHRFFNHQAGSKFRPQAILPSLMRIILLANLRAYSVWVIKTTV